MAGESVAAVLARNEQALLRLPNVTGVGIGEKDGREVIKVFVTRKVPASELGRDELVPRSLESIDVDVEEIGFVTVQDR